MKSMKNWCNVVLVSLVVFACMVFLVKISSNHNLRLDFTPGSDYTLPKQAEQVLGSLKKDMLFTVFYRKEDFEELYALFEMINNFSPEIKYKLVDLDCNPGLAKLNGIYDYGQTLVEYNGKNDIISFPTVARIINIVLKLTHERVTTVYFTNGHGEGSIKKRYENIKTALDAENYRVEEILLIGIKEIPQDYSILVINNPDKDFLGHEITMLSQYVETGGKIIILFEPFVTLPNLKKFMREYYIRVNKDIIIDVENKLFTEDHLSPLISSYAQCQITKSLKSASIFCTACSLDPQKNIANSRVTVVPLARTSQQSWAKSNISEIKKGNIHFIKGIDRPGPLIVALLVTVTKNNAVKDKRIEGNIVCFGDSDFINNRFLGKLGNKDLFLNAVNWLSHDENMISIRASTYKYPDYFMTSKQVNCIFMIVVVICPFVFLLIGTIVFLHRKRHG